MVITTETEWLTTAEAAKTLKVSPLTISRWIKQGRLAASRVGPRAVRIRRDDLEGIMSPIIDRADQPDDERWPPRPGPPAITDHIRAQRLAAIEQARIHGEAILARRNGVPLISSAEIIREMREERSSQL